MLTFKGLLYTAVSAVTLVPSAFAQSPSAIEEIIVTVRKREERLQDTPVAVSAFSAKDIQQRSIESLHDVALFTPGLTFESYSNSGFANPVLRGQAQLRVDAIDQNVATYFDGIYLPRQYVVDLGTFDLERVEIVKGPQSALYGRGGFSGVINYIPLQPSETYTATAFGTIGQYSRYDSYATASGPILKDKLLLRVGGGYSSFDGSVKNSNPSANIDYPKGSSGRLGGWTKNNAFVQLAAPVSDKLKFGAAIYHFYALDEISSAYRLQQSTTDLNCGARAANGAYKLFCGQFPYKESISDPRSRGLDLHSTIVRANASYDITEHLKAAYLFGYIQAKVYSLTDSSQDPTVGATLNFLTTPSGTTNLHSHEFRLQYDQAPLSITGGLYYQKATDVDSFKFFVYPRNTLPIADQAPILSLILTNNARNITETSAVFGEVTYRFLDDRASLDLQGRETFEHKKLYPSAASGSFFSAHYQYFTPRLTANYKITQENQVYVSAARGVHSGGFNTTVFNESQRVFQPDSNWTYEIGTKNTFLDRRVQINASIYYVDWNGIQTNVSVLGLPAGVTSPALIGNQAGATVPGFEISGEVVVAEGLKVNAGASVSHAKFKQGSISQRFKDLGICDGVVCPLDGADGGKTVPRQAQVQFTAGFAFDRPISDSSSVFVRGDLGYQGKVYAEEQNLSYFAPRTVVNASVGVTAQNDRYEVKLWAKNLFDEKYVSNAFFTPAATDVQYVPAIGDRRTFGVTLRLRY